MRLALIRRSFISICIAGCIGQSALVSANTSEPLQPFKATYNSAWDLGISFSGDVVRSLSKNEDGRWVFQTTAKALVASVLEQSTVDIKTNKQVEPLKYYYKRKVLGKKREAKLSFDWDKFNVHNDVENKPWDMAIPNGTQDKHSYQLQMRLDLKAGKRGPFSYQVADGGRLKTYNFNVVGEETLTLSTGEINAIKVERDRGPNSSRETFIWYAPEMDYLIVKLKQVEKDGKEYELELKSLETL